jgi:uncharacterized membrane protein
MPAFRSPAMLRPMARGQLLGKYPIAAAVFLSVLMLTLMVRLFFAVIININNANEALGTIISTAVSFIVSLPLGVVNVGVLLMALKVCCNEPLQISDLLYGFKKQPEKILAIQAILSGANLLALIPGTILLNSRPASDEADFTALVVALFIAGMAGYCYVMLLLSQVFFLLIDFEDKSVRELLAMAPLVMEGHKKRLFALWLSFLPLVLLSFLTCFLGLIWVVPFIKVTLANFYMDLMQNRS